MCLGLGFWGLGLMFWVWGLGFLGLGLRVLGLPRRRLVVGWDTLVAVWCHRREGWQGAAVGRPGSNAHPRLGKAKVACIWWVASSHRSEGILVGSSTRLLRRCGTVGRSPGKRRGIQRISVAHCGQAGYVKVRHDERKFIPLDPNAPTFGSCQGVTGRRLPVSVRTQRILRVGQ